MGDKGKAPSKEDNVDTKGTGESKDELILGKFKSQDEVVEGYTTLENKLSEQGQELARLRNEVKATKQPEPEPAMTPDFQAQRTEMLEKIDSGDVSLAEGLAALDEITREATKAEMETKFTEYDQKRSAQELFDGFVQDNPLYTELDAAGKLDEVIQQNPLHDKVSAFYELKAKIDAEEAYKKGQEEALRIAKGAEGTRTVLSNPGAESREAPAPKKGAPRAEVVQGMMGALAAARAT